MSIKPLALVTTLCLTACAPWQAPPKGPDPLARLRGHDAYGLVVSLGAPDVVPDLRAVEACAKRDEVCEVLLSEGGRYRYAGVKLAGTLDIDRVVVIKDQAKVGDIVRLDIPRDRALLPMSVELGARAAKRKGSACDWVDGSPETKTGGVVCNGWSYRNATAP